MKLLWIPEKRPEARARLLIAHHAGGASSSYFKFAKMLPSFIEPVLVELPGRGANFGLPLPKSLSKTAQDLSTAYLALPHLPTAFFGHSLGSLLVYEMSRCLVDSSHKPCHIFISSACRPDRYHQRWGVTPDAFSDAWLVQRLKKGGLTPDEVLENRELLNLILPVFRSDLFMLENYVPAHPLVLPYDATLFGGDRDLDVAQADLEEWKEVWAGSSELSIYEGGHFYLFENFPKLIEKISGVLKSKVLPGS